MKNKKNIQKRRIIMTILQKSKKLLIAGAFALSVIGAWTFASAQDLGTPPSTQPETNLQARVAALEATVASLQSQLAAIQANPALAPHEAKEPARPSTYTQSGPFYPQEKWGFHDLK
jgi:hypothetical protein